MPPPRCPALPRGGPCPCSVTHASGPWRWVLPVPGRTRRGDVSRDAQDSLRRRRGLAPRGQHRHRSPSGGWKEGAQPVPSWKLWPPQRVARGGAQSLGPGTGGRWAGGFPPRRPSIRPSTAPPPSCPSPCPTTRSRWGGCASGSTCRTPCTPCSSSVRLSACHRGPGAQKPRLTLPVPGAVPLTGPPAARSHVLALKSPWWSRGSLLYPDMSGRPVPAAAARRGVCVTRGKAAVVHFASRFFVAF